MPGLLVRQLSLILLLALSPVTGLQSQSGGSEHQGNTTFSVAVETVFVNVSVADPLNRFVSGLEKDNFQVFEDSVEQTISYFTCESTPVSFGVLFDVSGSMKKNIQASRSALIRFLQAGDPRDEFFLVNFNQKPELIHSFINFSSVARNPISLRKPGGQTALYDAVHLGLEHMRRARNEKKAIILITDGEDNRSRYCASEVWDLAKENDALIYAICEEGKLGYGRSEIQRIVGLTGGRAFFPKNLSELDYYVDLIRAELSQQYVLGFTPRNKTGDGGWRKLQVRVSAQEGFPKLSVRAREGYHASPKRSR